MSKRRDTVMMKTAENTSKQGKTETVRFRYLTYTFLRVFFVTVYYYTFPFFVLIYNYISIEARGKDNVEYRPGIWEKGFDPSISDD